MSISTRVIYLDSNATTPVMPLALEAARNVMEDDYGNPSSVHSSGLQAKALMENARKKASELLGCENGKLLFVSGATEGIQTAIFSALIALRDRRALGEMIGTDLLYGATEHKAVPESLHHWNTVLNLNFSIKTIPVDHQGKHDLDFLARHIVTAGLVCTMAANNETGIISDLDGIENLLKNSPSYWLVDGVQALGKLPLRLCNRRIDYSPFSGHKLYAPKGIGLLYVRNSAPFTPLLAGGGQEGNLRSGTENVSGIAALGAVLTALSDGVSFRQHDSLVKFRLQLLDAVKEAFPGLILNAPLEGSLPTTLNFSVPGLTSKELLDLFDAADVRVSAGSACSAAKAQPSFVLQAMQLPEWQAASAVRMSFGPGVTADYIDEACKRIRACGDALRKTCMISGDIEPLPADGVIQLSFGASCTWIVANAQSQECIVIDPLPELIERIVKYVRCQAYTVCAVVSTNAHPDQSTHNQVLRTLLAEAYTGSTSQENDFLRYNSALSLPNGKALEAIKIGTKYFATLTKEIASTYQFFLFGDKINNDGQLQLVPQFAFCGDALDPESNSKIDIEMISQLKTSINSNTLLCAAHDYNKQIVSKFEQDHDCCLDAVTIASSKLVEFIKDHPGTILVDVREPYEQQLSHFEVPAGTQVMHVPLTRLANGAERWLREPDAVRPTLLFFCRTGGRSSQAVQCLRRLGYQNSWHIAGGLALWQH